jgi:hypothetical protein
LARLGRPWERPLSGGEYVIEPRSVCVTSSSYALDGPGGLSFVMENFMPVRDWMFTWARTSP